VSAFCGGAQPKHADDCKPRKCAILNSFGLLRLSRMGALVVNRVRVFCDLLDDEMDWSGDLQ